MRLLVVLSMLYASSCAIPMRLVRQAPGQFIPGAFPPHGAIFIPQEQMGPDFDPKKPIPGHFLPRPSGGQQPQMQEMPMQMPNSAMMSHNVPVSPINPNPLTGFRAMPQQFQQQSTFQFVPSGGQSATGFSSSSVGGVSIQKGGLMEPLDTTTVSLPQDRLLQPSGSSLKMPFGFAPIPVSAPPNSMVGNPVQSPDAISALPRVQQTPFIPQPQLQSVNPTLQVVPVPINAVHPAPQEFTAQKGQPEVLPDSQTVDEAARQQTSPLQQGSLQPAPVQDEHAQNPKAPLLEQLSTTTVEPVPTGPIIDPSMPSVDRNVDLDGNGALGLPEVQYAAFVHHGLSGSVVESLFKQVDKNKDNYLNSAEFNEIRSLVLAKAENAAMRYMQSVDTDHNKMLSMAEAQAYILREYGIGSRDVERVWRLVKPDVDSEMDAAEFSKLRRRIRGMSIRLARQIMKLSADVNGDGHISREEAQAIAFEQEGIGAGDVNQMVLSVDDNGDGELNAPEFADFERIVRARAVETSRKALKVVDVDNSGTLTMDEARRIAFEHYGFDERILGPFFAQADENEDGQLDAVEFAGFRSVIRSRAVKNAVDALKEVDKDGDGLISRTEAEEKTAKEDDMEPAETHALFNIADQNKSGKLDKVELADFIRLVRLSAIKFATDHFREFDNNRDSVVTLDELVDLIAAKYRVNPDLTRSFFEMVDIDQSGDLIPAEIVDFRHEIRHFVENRDSGRQAQAEEFFFTTGRPVTPRSTVSPVTETAPEATTIVEVSTTEALSTTTLPEEQHTTETDITTAQTTVQPTITDSPTVVEDEPEQSRRPMVFKNRNKGVDDVSTSSEPKTEQATEIDVNKSIDSPSDAVSEDGVKLIDVSKEEPEETNTPTTNSNQQSPVQETPVEEFIPEVSIKTTLSTTTPRPTTPTRQPIAKILKTTTTIEDVHTSTESAKITTESKTEKNLTEEVEETAIEDLPVKEERETTTRRLPVTISTADEIVEYIEVEDDGKGGDKTEEIIEYIEEVVDDKEKKEEPLKATKDVSKRGDKKDAKSSAPTEGDLELVDKEYEVDDDTTTRKPSRIRIK